MMLCEYGCGQEAKYYFKSVKKWCCSKHYKKCPSQRELLKGSKNPFYGKHHTENVKKEQSNRMHIFMENPLNNPMKKFHIRKKFIGKKLTKEHKEKIRKSHLGKPGRKRTIEGLHDKYPIFSKIEEMRYNPDKPNEKEIQVHCKNHNCLNSKEQGGWFTPNGREIEARIYYIEQGSDGCYFYCSNKCKEECPLFNLKSDPFKDTSKSYIDSEYNQFREFVLKRDNYKCQYCGKKAEHVHHERPQKLEPFFSLDPEYGWSVCKKCHYEKGHSTGTKCSTGNLANKICK